MVRLLFKNWTFTVPFLHNILQALTLPHFYRLTFAFLLNLISSAHVWPH